MTRPAPRAAAASADAPVWQRGLAAALAFVVPLAIYWRTMAPTVYGVDSAELTTGAFLLGIVHPPGSPTYLLLAHLFTWLPVGDVGYRVNLLSAVAGAATSLLLFHIVTRLTGSRLIGLCTGLLAATTYHVWITALAAELYTLQACVMAALIALSRDGDPHSPPPRPPSAARLGLVWLLAGLGLGVHLATVLLLPGLAVLTLWPPNARRVGIAAVALTAGAAVYLYLPLRHLAGLPLDPARDYWQIDLASWDGFVWMLSGGGFRRKFFEVAPAALPVQLAHTVGWLWSNFLGIGALLGVLGIAAGLRQARQLHVGLLLMLAGHLGFYLFYGVGDTDVMNQPVLILWSIWIGIGAATAGDWLAERAGVANGAAIGGALLASMIALLVLVNSRRVDVSTDRSAREHGEAVLRALPPDALYVGQWSDLRIVEYLQFVEGRRPDLKRFDAFFSTTAERGRRIAAGLAAGIPVYVSTCRDLPDPALRCEYDAACECHRVTR